MISPANRPSQRHTERNLQSLIERAQVLGDQARRTMAELKTFRAQLEVRRGRAQRSVVQAYEVLRRADERLSASRALGG
jgi:hypothetical protein